MGGPRRSAFFLQALCVLLTLLDSQDTVDADTTACARWCPQHSKCVSASACRCDPGFTSSMETITNRLQICEDINECGPPMTVSCGRFADCQNTEGSYHCMCSQGYVLSSGGKTFKNKSENSCHDVNECILEQNPCHKSTYCLNIIGSYKCHCHPGWKPILGFPNGPSNTICEDVDECRSGQHQCHNSTSCVNTPGSFECSCLRGWVPKPGFQNNKTTTQCEEIFSTWHMPPGIKSQSLSRFFERVQILSRDFESASAQDIIRKLIESLDKLLEVPGDLEALTLHDQLRTATNLLSGLEHVLRTLAKTMLTAPFTYHSPADTELTLMIQERGNENVAMGQTHARMMLKWSEAAGEGDSGLVMAGMLSSQNMKKLLAKASLKLDLEKKDKLEKLHGSSVSGTQFKFLSAINSAFLSNTKTEKLDSPVTFAFSHLPETPGPRQELICAFWKGDNDSGGYWATTGCWKLGSQNGSTTCQCNHLSSFAILMAHYDIEDLKLALITKVGLALSLVCLLLCILTFLLVRPIQGSRTTVHLHLCICLFVGSAIFLAGIENQGGQVGIRCRLVAGLLHYCFLAAFCWMSLEGVELYILVVRVFPGQGLSKPWLYLIGYGVPGLIVLISAAVNSQGYGRDLYCWLNPNHGFLWSFLGPVTFIILCNAIIFVITVWKLTQKFSEINPDMKKLKKARVLTITAVSQLFLLGCTWIFGLFLFDPKSQVLAYAFTILTCLQGFFLFLLHCLLNKKVREEYRKWAGMVTRNKYSEFTTSTSGSNHNQTRVLRPSESGM